MKLIKSIKDSIKHRVSGLVERLVSDKHLDYETPYKELREVIDDPKVEKALYFAYKNPGLVYGEDSKEYYEVTVIGYFDSYFFEK